MAGVCPLSYMSCAWGEDNIDRRRAAGEEDCLVTSRRFIDNEFKLKMVRQNENILAHHF